MYIKNLTSQSIIVAMYVEGYDDKVERLEPGETSDIWVRLKDSDVIQIEEPKEGE